MSFLDKAKAAAETAAAKAKEGAEQVATKTREGVDEVQTKRALAHAYETLGRTAYGLATSGAIAHPDLQAGVDEIAKLEAHAAEGDAPEPATEPAAAAAPAEPEPATAPTEQ